MFAAILICGPVVFTSCSKNDDDNNVEVPATKNYFTLWNQCEALSALQEAGYSGCLTEVVGVKAPDESAGLSNALKSLSEHAIDIEYLYMLNTRAGVRTLVLGVADTARSEAALSSAGYELAQESELD